MTFKRMFTRIWYKKRLVLFVTIAFSVASILFALSRWTSEDNTSYIHTASASIYLTNKNDSPSETDLLQKDREIVAFKESLSSYKLLNKAVNIATNGNLTVEDIHKNINISLLPSMHIIVVSVSYKSDDVPVKLANSIVDLAIDGNKDNPNLDMEVLDYAVTSEPSLVTSPNPASAFTKNLMIYAVVGAFVGFVFSLCLALFYSEYKKLLYGKEDINDFFEDDSLVYHDLSTSTQFNDFLNMVLYEKSDLCLLDCIGICPEKSLQVMSNVISNNPNQCTLIKNPTFENLQHIRTDNILIIITPGKTTATMLENTISRLKTLKTKPIGFVFCGKIKHDK